jgi:hypothetical protein
MIFCFLCGYEYYRSNTDLESDGENTENEYEKYSFSIHNIKVCSKPLELIGALKLDGSSNRPANC